MKVVFMGTPEFAKQVLKSLKASKHEVIAVVCATDKKAGRGKKLEMPPVKKYALEEKLPVFQFQNINKQGVDFLKSLKADVFVTAAFGQILSSEILNIARFGTINVHGSLLPKYRGPSPVQYAILMGEKTTGVTIMQTNAKVDEGEVFLKKEIEIMPEDTTETLLVKLSALGGEALVELLDKLEKRTAVKTVQNHKNATKTFMLKKENSYINFNSFPHQIVNFVRAFYPNPVARFKYSNQDIKVLKAREYNFISQQQAEEMTFKTGEVIFANPKQGLVIACKQGFIEIEVLQAPASKAMEAKAFLNGKKIEIGTLL